ncbi:DUF6099 family protein [Streptomyces sp. CB01881]|uniref:DUF6099 family protein n=1 Tax=Streptomyces sp. CB01881 TaxID=2078691 RepID=UPI00129CBB90|nr:DUF6099 family protein [Streptomyces sp. CB01881]
MEALRLIKTARHALAEARNVPDVLAEARQAALLTEAVGARLAELDDGELAGLGQQLAEAGSHAAGCLDHSSGDSSALLGLGVGGRAGRLTEIGPLPPVLAELGALLRDVGETLVVLACGADTESLYWTCIDGVDAGADCKDLVARLGQAVRQAAGEYEREQAEPAVTGPPPKSQASEEETPLLVLRLGPPFGRSEARAPDDCSSARSAVTEASSSCSCSSRLFGMAGTADASVAGCCCTADASDQGSDMSGPLRIGSAV